MTQTNLHITIPSEIAMILQEAVDHGGYTNSEEVICEALQEWNQKQITQKFDIEKLRKFVQAGIDSGPGEDGEIVFARLEKKYGEMDSIIDN